MTDDLVEKALECCVNGEQLCDTCPYDENGYEEDGSCIQDLIRDMYGYVKRLRIENAELEARLEKAVELPCKLGKNFAIKDYGFGRYRVEEVDIIGYNFDPYSPEIFPVDRYEHGYLSKEVFPTREAAETRLKELQGGHGNADNGG